MSKIFLTKEEKVKRFDEVFEYLMLSETGPSLKVKHVQEIIYKDAPLEDPEIVSSAPNDNKTMYRCRYCGCSFTRDTADKVTAEDCFVCFPSKAVESDIPKEKCEPEETRSFTKKNKR